MTPTFYIQSGIDYKTCLYFQVSAKHKLQFLIGDQVLPYNMTVYQAVKQFSPLVSEHAELDGDIEAPLGN